MQSSSTVPGLVLRGDGNNLHRGAENTTVPKIANGLREAPYLQQQFYSLQEPTGRFLPRLTQHEAEALDAEYSPGGEAVLSTRSARQSVRRSGLAVGGRRR